MLAGIVIGVFIGANLGLVVFSIIRAGRDAKK